MIKWKEIIFLIIDTVIYKDEQVKELKYMSFWRNGNIKNFVGMTRKSGQLNRRTKNDGKTC